MSIVRFALHKGRPTVIVGLDRDDIDRIIGGDVLHLAAADPRFINLAIFAGETEADILENFATMGAPK